MLSDQYLEKYIVPVISTPNLVLRIGLCGLVMGSPRSLLLLDPRPNLLIIMTKAKEMFSEQYFEKFVISTPNLVCGLFWGSPRSLLLLHPRPNVKVTTAKTKEMLPSGHTLPSAFPRLSSPSHLSFPTHLS